MMKVLDLYSGIGGFSLGLERAGGFETVAFCEINDYCQKVLRKRWPHVPIENDVTKLKGNKYDANVLTGGFPCQPASLAGKRGGKSDDRWLWNENMRIVREGDFDWIIFENVPGLLSLVQYFTEPPVDSEGNPVGEVGATYDRVGRFIGAQCLEDLESAGYSVQVFIVPAAGVDARHLRNRVWIVAHHDRSTGETSGSREAQSDPVKCATSYSNSAGLREQQKPDARRSNSPVDAVDGESGGVFPYSRCNASRSNAGVQGHEEERPQGELQSANGGQGLLDDANPQNHDLGAGLRKSKSPGKRGRRSGHIPGKSDATNTPGVGQQGRGDWRGDAEEAIAALPGSTPRGAFESGEVWSGAITSEPLVCRGAHGIPNRMDRLKCLGNAVFPPIVQIFGMYIREVERAKALSKV